MVLVTILTLSLIAGQLAKLPFFNYGGLTLLDLTVFLVTVFYLIKSRFLLKNPPPFIKAIFVFLALGILSLILTPLHLQPIEYATSIFYSFRLLIFALFGWLVVSKVIFKKDIETEKILLYSGIGLALIGYLQFIFFPSLEPIADEGWDPHFQRIVSTFLDPNFLAAFLSMTLVLLYLNPNKIFTGKIRLAFFIIIYAAIVGTFSRGGYIMLTVSFLTLSLLTKSVKTFALTIILILGLGIGYYGYRLQVAKPRNVDRGASAQLRISSWQQGSQIFVQNPILGSGFNAYRYAMRDYNLASTGQLASRGATSNDSSLLFVASTTGIVGLLAYLSFLFFILKTGWILHRKADPSGTMSIVMIIGLLSQSFFSNLLFYPFILYWIFCVAGIARRTLNN